MSWAKLDDRLHSHTKARKAGLEAMGLWVLCLSHCAAQLTDGFVDMVDIETIGGANGLALAERLVVAGLWQHVEGGFEFRDYLDHNPSAEEVRAQREKYKQRQAKRRPGQKSVSGGVTRDTHVDTQGASRVTLSESHGECPPECHASPDPDPDPVISSPPAARARGAEREPVRSILVELRKHPILETIATIEIAEQVATYAITKPMSWIVLAIEDAATKATTQAALGEPWARSVIADRLIAYCRKGGEPRTPNAATPRGQGGAKTTAVQPRSPNADKWPSLDLLAGVDTTAPDFDPFDLLPEGYPKKCPGFFTSQTRARSQPSLFAVSRWLRRRLVGCSSA